MSRRIIEGVTENLAVHRLRIGLKYLHWLLIFSYLFGAGVSQAEGNIIVRDARGKTFQCGAYSRIVSLAPNITEILFFVKAEGLLKGVTRFCNYPEETAAIEKIGGISDVDVERIISLDPDLVIATKDGNPRRAVDFLEEAAIPSFVIHPRNIKETLDTMEKVACLSGAPADVFSKIDSMRRDLTGFARSRSGRKVRVLFLVSQSPMIAAGRGTFINEMINLSGGINVVEKLDFSYPRLGVEGILSLSPEVIFWVTSMGEDAGAGQLERVKEIVESDQIKTIAVDPDIYTRPGPRLFEGMREIGEILSRIR